MNSKAKITVASIISILSLASFGFSDGHSGDTYGPYPVLGSNPLFVLAALSIINVSVSFPVI